MIGFVSGVLVAGYLTASLFFARFWRQTRDRLFALFALAFALLAVQRAALLPLAGAGGGWVTALYLLRLFAFLLILLAVLDKNRPARD